MNIVQIHQILTETKMKKRIEMMHVLGLMSKFLTYF